MNSFELNKIMGAVLGTLLFVMGAGLVAEAIYAPKEDRGPGYALPEPELVAETDAGAEQAPAEPDLGTLLAAASVDRGAAAVRKCQSCHNFGEGEPNKMGPGLFGVVGRPEGSHEGFAYSDVLAAHNAAGDTWTYENLNAFLTAPAEYAPGTKMAFAGVRSAEERADILAYLQTLADEPVPFPAPSADAAAPAEDAAAGEAEAPAADAAAAAPESGILALLADASPESGEAAVRKCMACHSFGEGEADKMGPNLFGVVGRPEGGHEGYAYSDALAAHNAAGDTWTYENLDAFLTAPAEYAPGTKMAFSGVRSEKERADIVSYLRTLAADPVPLPGGAAAPAEEAPAAEEAAPAAEAPAEEAAPAEDAAAPAEEAPAAEEAAPAEDAAPAAEQAAPAEEEAAPAEAPAAEDAAPAEPAAEAAPAAEPAEPVAEAAPASALGGLLATASVDRGEAAVRKCQACHSFGEGEPNKMGPNLFDIVGRPEGGLEGYAYSEALAAHNAAGDTWTYENLDAFLTAPRDYAPGTKMAFTGVRSEKERADILAYFQTLSANPVPFPQ